MFYAVLNKNWMTTSLHMEFYYSFRAGLVTKYLSIADITVLKLSTFNMHFKHKSFSPQIACGSEHNLAIVGECILSKVSSRLLGFSSHFLFVCYF